MKVALLSEGFAGNSVEGFDFHRIITPELSHDIPVGHSDSVLNYDLFLADFSMQSVDSVVGLREIIEELRARILSGAAMLVFIDNPIAREDRHSINRFHCIPFLEKDISMNRYPATNLSLVWNTSILNGRLLSYANNVPADSLSRLIKQLESEYYFTQDLTSIVGNNKVARIPVFADPGGRSVSYLIINNRGGLILLLPKPRDRNKVLSWFFHDFLPHYNPSFQEENQDFEVRPPAWLKSERDSIPGVKEIVQLIKSHTDGIRKLEVSIDESHSSLSKLTRWTDLIAAYGKQLEKATGTALDLLLDLHGNWQHEPKGADGPDVVFEKDSVPFIIECGAFKGVATKDKGGQLLGWLLDADYAESHFGILLVNPLVATPLVDRKRLRKENSSQLVSEHLDRIAERRGFSIVWSVDIYSLVKARLSGAKLDEKEIITILQTPGLADFSSMYAE